MVAGNLDCSPKMRYVCFARFHHHPCYILVLIMQITLNEIDFLQIEQEELRLMEKQGMYPPHFQVVIDGKNTTQKVQAQIHFTGTTRDESLVCDIPLVPPSQGT